MATVSLKGVLAALVAGVSVLGIGVYPAIAQGRPISPSREKQASPEIPANGAMDIEPDLPVDTSNWQAFENRMPGGFPTLYVIGQVSLPNPGYEAELVRPVEQDYTDETLTLVLRINEPSGNFAYPAVIATDMVRYQDEFYLGAYEQVVVRGEDGSVLETIVVETF